MYNKSYLPWDTLSLNFKCFLAKTEEHRKNPCRYSTAFFSLLDTVLKSIIGEQGKSEGSKPVNVFFY